LVTDDPEPPAYLEDFRAGLLNPALLYSGSYEDGWVAEESYFRLRQPAGELGLAIRVNVPDVESRPRTMTVRVDDEAPQVLPLRLGRQDVRLPMKALAAATVRRVHLQFDRATALSAGDRRPASVLMEALGFRAPEAAPAVPAASTREIPVSGVSLGDHWYPYEEFGGAVFRWVERDAEVFIPSGSVGKGKLVLELEAGPGVGSKAFRLLVTDDTGKKVGLDCHGGRDKYGVPLPVKAGRNRFRLAVEGGGLPAPNDPRTLNFRVFRLEWSPDR
jgi:hypothetical protein